MADESIFEKYTAIEEKFESACTQLKIINERIGETKLRYDRAAAKNHRSFRYTLRIHLVSLEGVRNMFYEYARMKAEELDRMKLQIIEGLSDDSEEEMEM